MESRELPSVLSAAAGSARDLLLLKGNDMPRIKRKPSVAKVRKRGRKPRKPAGARKTARKAEEEMRIRPPLERTRALVQAATRVWLLKRQLADSPADSTIPS